MSEPIDHRFHDLQPVLPVKDVDATVAFYRDVLGFKVDFVVGSPGFHARVSRDLIMMQFRVGQPEVAQAAEGLFFYIHLGHVDGRGDLDALFQEYEAKGGKVTLVPTVQIWGLREFEIEDCNGWRLRFAVDA